MQEHMFAFMLVIVSCAGGTPPLEPPPAGGYQVVFIGNSLTAVNDLPGTLAQLAASADDTIRVESVTRPNFAVIDHVNGMSDAVNVIRRGGWDYVVLQQGPTSQGVGRDTLVLAARLLDPAIRAAGARIATLMVWPPSSNLSAFDEVRLSYQRAAEAVEGVFLPAGEAWRAAWAIDPTLPLYGGDGFHPSALGTYLAALVVYEEITGHDARSLPQQAVVAGQTLDVPGATVALLNRVAPPEGGTVRTCCAVRYHAVFTAAGNYWRRVGRSKDAAQVTAQGEEPAMPRMILTPSTNPTASPAPDPLLLFIQQAQLALVYSSPR
jgi:hypothetical protein